MDIRLASAPVTSIKMYVQKRGIWEFIKEEAKKARFFDFNNINFAKFTFSTDSSPKTVSTKIKVKKVDKARFRFENEQLNEPFGLYDIAFEFVENGYYKG